MELGTRGGGTRGSRRKVEINGYGQYTLHKCMEHSKNIIEKGVLLIITLSYIIQLNIINNISNI